MQLALREVNGSNFSQKVAILAKKFDVENFRI